MKPRLIIFAVLALLVAFGTAHMARNWLAGQREALEAESRAKKVGTYILVAARDLPTGGFVRVEDLRWQSWPDSDVHDTYLRQDKDKLESLAGAVVRQHIAAGAPVTLGQVIKPGDRGFLAAVLNPGMRAVSVPVTATSGISGLVFPGDRVDLVLTHAIRDPRSSAPPRNASETVLTDLRVLAVDQTTDDKDGKPVLARTVTFEVTPHQAEMVEVASELGKIALSLRSLAQEDQDSSATPAGGDVVTYTWDSDVSVLMRPQARRSDGEAPPNMVTVLRGESVTTVPGAPNAAPPAPAAGYAPAASGAPTPGAVSNAGSAAAATMSMGVAP